MKKRANIHYFNSHNLVGRQILAVCNFKKKNIAGIVSEGLILGQLKKMEK